jgi:BMFP domain-containing protein YqiC|tara:strand:- start:37 stop:282 length:246 start_codon:yes stop_codon:yes gene_type:complete
MNNSEKIMGLLSGLVKNGILTSKDVKKEILNDLKFRKDELINKLQLVSKEEFEILKKIVQKQDKEIQKLKKNKKIKKAKKS